MQITHPVNEMIQDQKKVVKRHTLGNINLEITSTQIRIHMCHSM